MQRFAGVREGGDEESVQKAQRCPQAPIAKIRSAEEKDIRRVQSEDY